MEEKGGKLSEVVQHLKPGKDPSIRFPHVSVSPSETITSSKK
jgi:hypothetical protein